jgi:hypothetical protein
MTESATISPNARRASSAASEAAARRPRWPVSSRYVVTLVVMGAAALSLQVAATWAGVHFRKQAVPLRKPLFQLDINRFRPLYDFHQVQEPPLSAEQLDPLGTEEYVNWRLIDRQRDARDATRAANIFVTYFTGRPDQVPHVPEECLRASGYQLIADTTEYVIVPGVGAPDDRLPIRVQEFGPPAQRDVAGLQQTPGRRLTMIYFFVVNGQYRTTRTEVRRAHMNLFDRYAYYAKVELWFSDESQRTLADRQSTLNAAAPLLRRLLTALREDHFQDWATWTSGPSSGQADRASGATTPQGN